MKLNIRRPVAAEVCPLGVQKLIESGKRIAIIRDEAHALTNISADIQIDTL